MEESSNTQSLYELLNKIEKQITSLNIEERRKFIFDMKDLYNKLKEDYNLASDGEEIKKQLLTIDNDRIREMAQKIVCTLHHTDKYNPTSTISYSIGDIEIDVCYSYDGEQWRGTVTILLDDCEAGDEVKIWFKGKIFYILDETIDQVSQLLKIDRELVIPFLDKLTCF